MEKVEPRMTALDFDPVYVDPATEQLLRKLGWLVRAIGRERTIQQIPPGEWLQVPYSRLSPYCPQNVVDEMLLLRGVTHLNKTQRADMRCLVVPWCVGLAEDEEMVAIKRSPGRAHRYRLLKHPIVEAVFRQASLMVMQATETRH